MATDPRQYIRNYKEKRGLCDRKTLVNTNQKNSFLKDIGKIGGFEGLNKIGLGKIGKGLRDLVSISEGTKIGRAVSKIFTNNSDANGANSVLSAVGIEPRNLDLLKSFNVVAANEGLATAELIFQKIKNGEFKLSDLPTTIGDFERLFDLISRIFVNGENDLGHAEEGCEPTPYALNLMLENGPKYKFLFVVEFAFNAPYAALYDNSQKMAFLVKYSDRPSISFEYEDVNMYNYRTKIPKRTVYNPVSLKFYDGGDNSAMRFYEAYLKAMSPIANLINNDPKNYQATGMDFSRMNSSNVSNINNASHQYSASLGPLINDSGFNILGKIRIYHVYDYGKKVNLFSLNNPKLVELNLDELDMTAGTTVNEVSIKVEYDGLFLETDLTLSADGGVLIKNNVFDGVGGLNGSVSPNEQQSSEIFDILNTTNAGIVEKAGGIVNITNTATTQAKKFKNFLG